MFLVQLPPKLSKLPLFWLREFVPNLSGKHEILTFSPALAKLLHMLESTTIIFMISDRARTHAVSQTGTDYSRNLLCTLSDVSSDGKLSAKDVAGMDRCEDCSC